MMVAVLSFRKIPMGEFGNKFRQAREKKNLSLDDVSNVTKISARMLQAIEQEQFDQLPGGVFNKGFIRAYAKHLGLDAEEAVTDYLTCLREAQIGAQEIWETVRPDPVRVTASTKARATDGQKVAVKSPPAVQVEELPNLQLPRLQDVRPPRRDFAGKPESGIPWTIIAAAAFVLVLAIFLWTRHSRSTNAAKSSAPPVTASNTTPPIPVATVTAPALKTTTQSTPAQLTAKSATKPAQPTTPAPASATSSSSPLTKKSADVSRPLTASKTAVETAPSLTVVVRASETSWISVQADGQLVTQETLIAPAATSFHANRELVIRVGNAAGVSFLWKGEELPAQGAEAEVKTFVFDAQGMRAPASDQAPR
jgi:cytoskeleton protein RodZ